MTPRDEGRPPRKKGPPRRGAGRGDARGGTPRTPQRSTLATQTRGLVPPSPARAAALGVLLKADDPESSGIEDLLHERRSTMSHEDVALAREISCGVLRQRNWLDTLLKRWLEAPLPPNAEVIQWILRMGAYQAAFLDRVPAHAIVDDAVKLAARRHPNASMQGLVNAILRRVTDTPREQLLPSADSPWRERYSVPDWLAGEGQHVLGRDTLEPFFAALNRPATLQFRICGEAAARSQAVIDAVRRELGPRAIIEPGHFLPTAFSVADSSLNPEAITAFREGEITVMDEGAQLAAALAGAAPGDTVLDFCAAPGGKTAALWDAMERRGRLIALDMSKGKLERLRETLSRLGMEKDIQRHVTTDYLARPRREVFDIVMLDAPCSSLGTIRRHPEIRWRRRTEDIVKMSMLQRELVEQAASLVRPGGILLYCVCTFTRDEGRSQVDYFVRKQRTFDYEDAPSAVPAAASSARLSKGCWLTRPDRDGCDAFFIARLRRKA